MGYFFVVLLVGGVWQCFLWPVISNERRKDQRGVVTPGQKWTDDSPEDEKIKQKAILLFPRSPSRSRCGAAAAAVLACYPVHTAITRAQNAFCSSNLYAAAAKSSKRQRGSTRIMSHDVCECLEPTARRDLSITQPASKILMKKKSIITSTKMSPARARACKFRVVRFRVCYVPNMIGQNDPYNIQHIV